MTTTLRIKNPGDLIAAVPSVLGFHPEDSVVLLTLGAAPEPFFARVDMPACGDDVATVVDQLAEVSVRHAVGRVALVTYSDDAALSDAVVVDLSRRLEPHGIEVPLSVRADGARWFPAGGLAVVGAAGTPYDVTTHPFTLQSVVDGRVVHESRNALRDSLLPSDPEEVEAVERAVDEAVDRFEAASRHPLGPPNPDGAAAHLVTEGRWVQHRVRQFARDRARLDAHDVGRMVVALVSVQVRDVAWSEMDRAGARVHVDLWRDVVRRAPIETLAAPAALLAFAAWLSGDGALAWCAVDRCQESDPGYSMAGLVSQALAGAVPPSSWEPVPPDSLPLFAS